MLKYEAKTDTQMWIVYKVVTWSQPTNQKSFLWEGKHLPISYIIQILEDAYLAEMWFKVFLGSNWKLR